MFHSHSAPRIFKTVLIFIVAVLCAWFAFFGVTNAQYGSGDFGDGSFDESSADILAPTVSLVAGPSNGTDTTPDFTYSSTEVGTVTYSGSCDAADTTASVGNNTVTLNALAVATYSDCTITVTDGSSNESSSLNIGTFTISATPDITEPTISLISAVSDGTDTTPDFTYSSTEVGTVTYSGSCDAADTTASVGNNTVTLNALAVATYSDCTITVTDGSSNESSSLNIGTFTISAASSGGGGGGGGGSSSSGGNDDDDEVETTEVVTSNEVAANPLSPTPTQPVSAESPSPLLKNFTFDNNISFNRPEMNNNVDVLNVAIFLNHYEGEDLSLDYEYDATDVAAMNRFQIKYRRAILDVWNLSEPTGFIGITTRLKMNVLMTDQSGTCPVFTEFNGGLKGIRQSAEIGRTQEVLRDLDIYFGPIDNTWTTATNQALIVFQEKFREVMLDPWRITAGTGYKYKTTNKFLNYFAGCESGAVELEGVGSFDF